MEKIRLTIFNRKYCPFCGEEKALPAPGDENIFVCRCGARFPGNFTPIEVGSWFVCASAGVVAAIIVIALRGGVL